MAKRDIPYAVERTVNSLQNAMSNGVEEGDLLAIYKSRLFDENLVEKNRRNQVLVEVNKQLGMDFKMRDIKNASNKFLDQVNKDGIDDSPEVIQHADDLPALSPEYIADNPEEFTSDEVNAAKVHLHKASPVAEITTAVSDNSVKSNSEEVNMKTNASNQYNSTTSATAADANNTGAAENTIDPTLNNTAGAEQANANNANTEQAKPNEEQKAADNNIADESFMDKVNGIRPEYLAAGAAVIGAAGSILTAESINAANVGGGIAGVAASYFGAQYLLGERENTLVTKSLALSGGLVIGAVSSRGVDILANRFFGDKVPAVLENGETVVTVTPAPMPAPVVTVEQAPMF